MANPAHKKAAAEPCELIVKIERYEQTYYISEHGPDGRATSDEALIDIRGCIVAISRKLKQHLNERLDVSFACATSYSDTDRTPVSDNPFLLRMNLRKDHRGFMTYLPANAFWSISAMIDAERLTHIEARFDAPHYGSGGLLGVYLMPESTFRRLLHESSSLVSKDEI